MNYRSAIQYCRLLLRGDSKAWKYLPYQLKLKMKGIDLHWASLDEIGLSEERAYRYSDSGGPDLEDLLNALSISPSDAVLDLGCGKGGALITLAQYPFARVDGVELSPDLAQVAQANIRKLNISRSKIVCCDAADFGDLDSYTHFYMYNPFPRTVTSRVLENFQLSMLRRPRRVILIYKNAVFNSLVLDAGFRTIVETARTHPDYPPFSVYAADGPVGNGSHELPAC